ncbi:phosphate ABC transporter substrate-binding protein [Bacterioplanoides sp. SCSIO 12839]|uniref:phosphate ABC transporter substrate-binding protein n=1 Tax=Bacterioplanoides sp. SCSIO 12839 TaxID=2829569 RepID=UPI002106D9AC|nr:phosphate ABC transporter substrate-binding protein [Bacterioplanoides sp. SCSIO 12839]UTW48395.1 phosphate ABC transporter substrate-binding protein [Bacterioplanoides sp. SCSIO 12839]
MKFINTLCLLCLLSFSSAAEIVVIVGVNNSNTYTGLEQDEIKRIFLGKTSQFPDGTTAVAYSLPKGNKTRAEFAKRYLGKTESQLNSYWSRRIFAGKQKPPKATDNPQEMKQKVAANEKAIGYIDSKDLDSTVVVIHRFK